jgi:hypothetical protein
MEGARSILMAALILGSASDVKSDDVTIKSTQGVVLFQKKGDLISETEHSILVFHMDCIEITNAVEAFKKLIVKKGDNKHHSWSNSMVADLSILQGNLGAMGALTEVTEGGQREKKSFASWAISFFGLWNFWGIKSVEGRLQHTNEAVQLTAKTIDSTIQFAAENAYNIERLERNLRDSNVRADAMVFWVRAESHWGNLRRIARGFIKIVLQATHHLLSHDIMEFINLPLEWEAFTEQLQAAGWEPAFKSWANIFQQKADFWYGDGVLKIVVKIPVSKPHAVRMTLYRWLPLPLMSNASVLHITTPQRWFAIEEETGLSMTLSSNQLEKCTRIRGTHFCTAATARYLAGQGSCLQALWAESVADIKSRCPITLLPLSPQIWRAGNSTFLVTARRSTDVAVRCLGRSQVSRKLTMGMSIVTVAKECLVSTASWATVQGTESNEVVVVWEVQQQHVHHLINNDTTLTMDVIKRPRAVAEIGQEVRNRLSLGGFLPEKIGAMILGGTALFIILLAVGVLRFKAMYGSLTGFFSKTMEMGIGETPKEEV